MQKTTKKIINNFIKLNKKYDSLLELMSAFKEDDGKKNLTKLQKSVEALINEFTSFSKTLNVTKKTFFPEN
jgi:acetone carboxylase gamma subunit